MIGLLQRVTEASVSVDDRRIARIGTGLLVFVGVEREDGARQAQRLAERILAYRVFPDARGRMNLGLLEARAALLLVPQFTLAADTDSGNRPGFSTAAPPDVGRQRFDELAAHCTALGAAPAQGRFGAHMQVALVNDGPVTFSLRVPPK